MSAPAAPTKKPSSIIVYHTPASMPQVPITVSDEELRELERLRDRTGLPVARLLDLQRRGFQVTAIKHR